MNILKWFIGLFKKKVRANKMAIEQKVIHIPKLRDSYRTTQMKKWYNQTYRGRAHRMPLAKFMNPDKYF